MRMWMVEPEILCRKHLLGEHGEIHKFKPSFEKQFSITGRIHPVVQIEPLSMKVRHDILAAEMKRRKMNHDSPYFMPDLRYLGKDASAVVDIDISMQDLISRCSDCKSRYHLWLAKQIQKEVTHGN